MSRMLLSLLTITKNTGEFRIVGSVNVETFKRNLSKYVNSFLLVYQELEKVIFYRKRSRGVYDADRLGPTQLKPY